MAPNPQSRSAFGPPVFVPGAFVPRTFVSRVFIPRVFIPSVQPVQQGRRVLVSRVVVPSAVMSRVVVPDAVFVPLAVSAAGDAPSPVAFVTQKPAVASAYSLPFNTQKKTADSDIAVANTPSTRYSKGS